MSLRLYFPFLSIESLSSSASHPARFAPFPLRCCAVVAALSLCSPAVLAQLPAPGSSGSAPSAIPSSASSPLVSEPTIISEPASIGDKIVNAEPAKNLQTQAIRHIRIVGNTKLSTQALLADLEGAPSDASQDEQPVRTLNFAQMQELANRVTAIYRAQGYLVAQAFLPQQDITQGVLTIAVLEGRLGQVTVKAQTEEVSSRVQEVMDAQLGANLVLEQASLERAVLLSGELSNQSVLAQLSPGATTGTSNVNAQATPLPDYFASVTVDNYGIPSTGQTRFTADLGLSSVLTAGDRLALEVGTTNNPNLSRRYDASYVLPIGLEGFSLGARAWQSNYALGGEFNTLGATGLAQAQGVHLGYALVRSAQAKADLRVGYNWIGLSDQMQTVSYFNPRHTRAAWTDIGGWIDDQQLGTGARTTWVASATAGNLVFDNGVRQAYDLLNNNTQGEYNVFTYGLGREQGLVSGTSAYANVRGQRASRNLDSYYKFSLGGPTAVRAYPIGEVMGDDATVMTAELRYTTNWSFDEYAGYSRIALFYDWGSAQLNHSPTSVQAPSNKAIRAGYGVGLDLGWSKYANGTVYWAKCTDSLGYSQATGNSAVVGAQLTLGF